MALDVARVIDIGLDPEPPRFLIYDCDSHYGTTLDLPLKALGITAK